ncbi:hypothetical protein GO730_01885 [Spirosoma sp. HMF3257]|uniref:Ig-like domain-containing protein n=1 Tax=Spirosoma telluris TaxID=2183553 RepID=UPI0011B93511|nr:hypothetical protein [Spirosoma telluris]
MNELIFVKSLPFFCNTLYLILFLAMSLSSVSVGQSLSVSMSFPAFRTSFITGTPVNIQATTTTPASTTVTKVEFFLATFTGPGNSKVTVKLGEDLTAPFSYTWTIPDGQISYNELSLKVTNSTGATAVQGGLATIGSMCMRPTRRAIKNIMYRPGQIRVPPGRWRLRSTRFSGALMQPPPAIVFL